MTEDKIKQTREKRITSLEKANQIKYSQYLTSVHALPEKVLNRLNMYLNMKLPSMVCLRKLCSEFPTVWLPSYKAVQNYRKKYHVSGSKYQETIEFQKQQQKKALDRLLMYQTRVK